MLKKTTSILLALIIALSMFAAVPVTASAADDSFTVNATANAFFRKATAIYSNGAPETVTVCYYADVNTNIRLQAIDLNVTYDENVLTIDPAKNGGYDENGYLSAMMPIKKEGNFTLVDVSKAGTVRFADSDIKGYKLRDSSGELIPVMKIVFDVADGANGTTDVAVTFKNLHFQEGSNSLITYTVYRNGFDQDVYDEITSEGGNPYIEITPEGDEPAPEPPTEAQPTTAEPTTEETTTEETTIELTGQCGKNVKYTLYRDGLLEISGSGDMYNYYRESNVPWYDKREQINEVVIGEGVTSIGDYALNECTSLASLTIPDSVTSIGKCAGFGCTNLTSLTIPDSVTSIGDSAFWGCKSLTGITIPDSITSIGEHLFYRCDSLESITIPDSVTSIGKSAFGDCPGLASVTIGNGVTSIGELAFDECRNLTSLTIGNGVASIGEYAFRDCSSLTSVSIPDNVTSIGKRAFYDCTRLESVTIGNGVTSIGEYAFSECSSLTSLTIGNSVTSIGDYMFSECSSLTSVTIPDSVTSIGKRAFSDCSSLASVTIGDSVTSIDEYAFKECSSLTSVTIGNSVTSIGNKAFNYCDSLKSVHISDIASWCKIRFDTYDSNPLTYAENLYLNNELITNLTIPNSVTSIEKYAFIDCKSLISITIPDSVTSIGASAFSGCSSLTSITIPDSVTSIGASAFSGCNSLTSITIPDSVTSIGEWAFCACTSLISITIPDSVTSIGKRAFSDCSSLISITIPDSVTSIGDYAIYNCYKFDHVFYSGNESQWEQISIGDNNTILTDATRHYNTNDTIVQNVVPPACTSQGYTFYQCPICQKEFDKMNFIDATGHQYENGICSVCGFEDPTEPYPEPLDASCFEYTVSNNQVRITGLKDDTATDIVIPYTIEDLPVVSISSNAFDSCSQITSVTIPDSVTYIGESAFSYCSKLTSITMGNGVKSIGGYAFNGCDSLTSVAIGNNVASIGSYAFWNCTGLKSITIPDSVTSIGGYAFFECTGLTSVTIPDSVTKIGYSAFEDCTAMTSITIGNGVESIGGWAFDGCTGLTRVNISDLAAWCDIYFDTDNSNPLCYAHNLYLNDELVTDLVIPDGVPTIGIHAFLGCTGLKSLTIPASVWSIWEGSFSWCTGLTSITVDPDNETYDSRNNCNAIIYTSKNELLLGCKSTVIPDSVTSIGKLAFAGCAGLESITIPDSVTSIGNIAFSGCAGLESVTIPGSVTSIGDYAFGDCTGLTSVIIGNGVKSIDDAFAGCTGLTSITIPDSVKSIGAEPLDGTHAFDDCTSLTRVNISDLAAWCKIEFDISDSNPLSFAHNLYLNDELVTDLVIPDSVTSIGEYAFSGGTCFTSVTIPDSVTSIGEYAFYECNGLTSVTIPGSVTSIGEYAFGYYFFDWEYLKVDDFTIYGVKGSEAERYANDNGFRFVEIENNQTYTDEETNISVTSDEGLTLKVVKKSETEVGDIVLGQGEALHSVFDISLLKDGAEVQPDGKTTVRIPCDVEGAKVYRVETDGSLTDMHAVYENGYLVFTTDHFSIYIVSEPAAPVETLIGDVNGDNSIDVLDATMIQKYAVDKVTLTDEQKEVADVNDDGEVDILDATDIQKYTVDKITEFKKRA